MLGFRNKGVKNDTFFNVPKYRKIICQSNDVWQGVEIEKIE